MRWALWALMVMTTACVTAPTGGSPEVCADGTSTANADNLPLGYLGEPDPEPGEPEPAILDRHRSRCQDIARVDPPNR